MKRDFKRLFSLMLVMAVMVVAFVCTAAPVAAEGEKTTIAADTVLEADATYGDLEVADDVTLDLNGNTLTVNGALLAEKANIIDSTNGAGKLVCANMALNTSNSYLPVRVAENSYALVQPDVSANFQKFVEQTDGSYYFAFRPNFAPVDGSMNYLTGDHGLRMEFTLLTADGYVVEDANMEAMERYFNDEVFAKVYGENKMFFVRVRNGYKVDQLRFKTAIYSEATNVRYSSETMVGKVVPVDFNRDKDTTDFSTSKTIDNFSIIIKDAANIPANKPNTLRYVAATTSTTVSCPDLREIGKVFFRVRFSDFAFTDETKATFFSIRLRNEANTGYNEFIQVRGDDAVLVGGQSLGSWRAAGEADLIVAYEFSTGNFEAYNLTTEVTTSGTYSLMSGNGFYAYNTAGACLDLSNVEIFADVNATLDSVVAAFKEKATISQTVTWTWDDGGNADKLRPDMVKVAIYNGDTKVDEADVKADLGTYTFDNLPKYDVNGNKITYTFQAEAEHYVPSVADNAVTFKHTPFTITYYYNNDFQNVVYKNNTTTGYDYILDGANKELRVFAGQIAAAVVDGDGCIELLSAADKNSGAYSGVPTPFTEIKFRIRYDGDGSIPKFNIRVSNKGGNIGKISGTSIAFGSHSKSLKGNWVDVELHVDFDGKKVDYRFGNETLGYSEGTVTITATSGYRFEISYETMGAFDKLYIDDLQIFAPVETVDVTGAIDWQDANNYDNVRPETLTLNLYNGSILVDQAEVNEANGWQYVFEALPKTNATNGVDYSYSVDVAEAPEVLTGYTKTISGNTVILKHIPEKIYLFDSDFATSDDGQDTSLADSRGNAMDMIKGNHVVNDGYLTLRGDAASGKRLFFVNGVSETSTPVLDISFKVWLETADSSVPAGRNNNYPAAFRTNNGDNNCLIRFIGQNVYAGDASGEYLVLSDNVPVEVTIHADFIGDTIYVELKKDGEEPVKVTENYNYVVNRLEFYALSEGAFGLCIDDLKISKDVPATTSLTGAVTWNHGGNIAPQTAPVTVGLQKNGEVIATQVASEENGWTYSFENLTAYNEDGTSCGYTLVITDELDDYVPVRTTMSQIAMTYRYGSVKVTIAWAGDNGDTSLRPDNVTVDIYDGSSPVKTEAVENTATSHTFENVDLYRDNGTKITFVPYGTAEGYKVTVSGMKVTFTLQ